MSMLSPQELKEQIFHITKAQQLNKITPKPWPRRNPEEERLRWQMKVLQFKNATAMGQIKSAVISGDIHSCKTSFEKLMPLSLREMKLPMVHSGKFLVCKVIGQPLPNVGVSALIEDLNGDVEEVIVYNFCYNNNEVSWLKLGTIFIVKEPWLRYGLRGDCFSIRIDSPSDIIFVDPTDIDFLSKIGAEKWREIESKDIKIINQEAQEFFKKGKYGDALQLYERAIRYYPEQPISYLNKAFTCLRTSSFYTAYKAAKLALEKTGVDREKALIRMGQAAYGIRDWQKAIDHFTEVLKDFPNNSLASEQLKRANDRLAEQMTGKFDFKAIYLGSKENKPADISDYSDGVKIVTIPGKGRGIIASKDIQKGTVLVVSKSFASSHSKDFPGKLISINLIQNAEGTAAELLQAIRTMENVQKNPKRAKEIYDLYAGDLAEMEIPDGVIDAARIQKICALNCYASEDSIRGVFEDCHLFTLPSYFNHACIANAHQTIYGDVMIVRASTNIKKGDEICLSYTHPLNSDRKTRLNCWKFECQCCLCKVETEDSLCSKRYQIFEEFIKYALGHYPPKMIIDKCEPLMKKMRETYSNQTIFKLHLAQMLAHLAPVYADLKNIPKAIECYEEAIILAADPFEYVLDVTYFKVNLAVCYSLKGQTSEAKEMAQKAFQMSLCNDMDYFKMIYPEVAKLV